MNANKAKAELIAKIEALRKEAAKLKGAAEPFLSDGSSMQIESGERRSRLRQTLESIPHGVLETDLDGVIVYCNSACHKILGYSNQDLVGTSLFDRVESDDERRLLRDLFTTSGKEQPSPSHYFTTRQQKNGRWIELQVDWNNQRDREGNLVGYISVLTDITDRVQAESTQKENEQRLSEILDVAAEAIVSVDENHKIVLFNKGAERIFGFQEDEVIDRPLSILLPEDVQSEHQRLIEEFSYDPVNTREMRSRGEIRGRRRNGEVFPAEASISKIEVGGKEVFTAFLRDITERKRTETELQESEAKYRDLVETSHDLICRVDVDGRFTYLNATWQAILGYNQEEMLGHLYTEFRAPGEVENSFRVFKEILAGRSIINSESTFISKSGHALIFSLNLKPTHNNHGELLGAQGTAQDVTAQKQTEEKLRQSLKMQALGTLAGGIAHDFNNVLTPILGNAEMLMEDLTIRDENRESAESIYDNALRAKNLVSQILLFSRRGQTVKKVEDLCPLISELISFARSTLPATITVSEEVLAQSAPVYCDSSQIHQVLVNLCVNAGQAITGTGEIRITLDVVVLEGLSCVVGKLLTGRHVQITVSDDGEGMDANTLGHIFEPFYTTKAVGEGTGLGLSTVFGIVQGHRGGLTVSSELDKGTTFKIFLPLAAERAEKPAASPNKIQVAGSEHILLVDDEDSITSLGKKSLQRLGYQVTIASDGQIALDIFLKNPGLYDMVVTDQTMPNLTGDLLAHEVLKLRPDMPIILCSGHNTEVTPENSESIGIRRFMYKPYGPKELAQLIREVLDQEVYK